ncbi:MAG: hypothetical protein IJ141_02960 [Lachnospiraceae bacterium]|nr:hypothetical protein [Lachnospiraceae bacterium]
MSLQDLNILFLAKFAPNSNGKYPLATKETDGIYAQYHYDIYKILKDICPKTISVRDPSILLNSNNKFDYVFTLLNRAPYRNSEIFVSALLEYLNTPYLGTTPNIRAVAEDKHLAKIVAEHAGLNTPEWITIDCNNKIPDCQPFEGPFFVKPRFGASSAYIDENSINTKWGDAKRRILFLQQLNIDVIVEKFIDGIYYSVPIYFSNNKPIHLPAVKEISSMPGNVVTYEQKRKLVAGLIRQVNDDFILEKKFTTLTDNFLKVIHPLDYTRIDFIVTSNSIEFIEFNVCCNLGKHSSFCISANKVGITQKELVREILINSLQRQKVII